MKKKKTLDEAMMEFKSIGPTLGGWKITELSAEKAANHMVHVQNMVKEAKELRGDWKPTVSTKQALSAERVLMMTEEEAEIYRNRPMPTKEASQVWKDGEAATLALTEAEAKKESMDGLILEAARRKSKNTQGTTGEETAFDLTKKLAAQSAYMETKAKLSDFEQKLIKVNDPEIFAGKSKPDSNVPGKISGFLSKLLGKIRSHHGESDRIRWQDYVKEEKK